MRQAERGSPVAAAGLCECPQEPRGAGWRAGGSPQAPVPRRSRGRAGRGTGAGVGPWGPPRALVVKAQGNPVLQTCCCQRSSLRFPGLGRGHCPGRPRFPQSRESCPGSFLLLRCCWHTCSFLNGRNTTNAPTALSVKVPPKHRVRRNSFIQT